MNKILFLSLSLILIACAPQATPPLPPVGKGTGVRETPLSMPTLHPQFIEAQSFIASSERFTLLLDGTIEEVTADGGQQTIPNLHVAQNGVVEIFLK